MIESANNKIVELPMDNVRAIGKGVIIKTTDKFVKTKTPSGITLPTSSSMGSEKKYDIGEVYAAGEACEEVSVGDIVIFQIVNAVPLPNGLKDPVLYKVEENPMSIVARVPKEFVEEALAQFESQFAEIEQS
jgi:co-chaperonin GroES (HSP10)